MQPTCATYFNQNLALNAKNTSIFSQKRTPGAPRHVRGEAHVPAAAAGALPLAVAVGTVGGGGGKRKGGGGVNPSKMRVLGH